MLLQCCFRQLAGADHRNMSHRGLWKYSPETRSIAVYPPELRLTILGYAVCSIFKRAYLMMQAASSMSVKDERTGKLLLSMRFAGFAEATDYLSVAQLVCSECGKQFSGRSTITLMNRGDSWELMLPHHCEPQPPPPAEQSNKNEAHA